MEGFANRLFVQSRGTTRGYEGEQNKILLIRVKRVEDVQTRRLHVLIAIQSLLKGFYSVRIHNLVW